MQVSAIKSFQKNNQPQFKSTIPVYHWVKEAGGSFAPVADYEITKKLQEKLIKAFNKPNNIYHNDAFKNAIKYLKEKDIYYSLRMKYNDNTGKKSKLTRSFYNPRAGWNYDFTKFKPMSYLITGIDVDYFDNNFAKDLGRAKATERELKDKASSADLKMAWHNYFVNGLDFVNDKKHHIRDLKGISYGIHTKFEAIRDSEGKVKDFNFIDLKLLPETGYENPFNRLFSRKK